MVYANQENHTVSSWPLNYVDFTCRIKNGKRSPVVLWIYYAVGYKEKITMMMMTTQRSVVCLFMYKKYYSITLVNFFINSSPHFTFMKNSHFFSNNSLNSFSVFFCIFSMLSLSFSLVLLQSTVLWNGVYHLL